jgi:1,4-alpha-glucan branching enzyme
MYGGSNMGNGGGVMTIDQPSHGFEHSLTVTVPPLGFVLLKR